MNRKKVHHLINSLKFGGAERFLLDTYPHLDHELKDHIIYPIFHTGEYFADAKIKLADKKPAKFWFFVFSSSSVFAKIFKPLLPIYYAYYALCYNLKNNAELTVVYICQLGIAYSFATKIMKLIGKKPKSWVLRIGSDIDSPIYFPRLMANLCVKGVRPMFKLMITAAPNVITVDPELSTKIANVYKKNHKNIYTVPNCCTEKTASKGLNLEEKTFVALGRLHYQKGFDFLIKAFAHFVRKYPEYRLVIIGEGVQKKSLEKLIKKYSLRKHVQLLGFIKEPELLLKSAEACIVSSRSEGFCKVIVEAMQMQTIVLAHNCDFGPRTIIEHGINGFLFNKLDIADFTKKLEKIINLDEKSRTNIKNLANIRAKDFDAKKIANIMESTLNICAI